MATTAEYLTQLQTDKTTLVTNLVAKGVDATNDETFTTLVPKVANIQGGSKYAPRYISFYAYTGTELDYEIANLDTSNVTSMIYMFSGCDKLTTLDLSSFNTSNVTSMSNMFQNCSKLLDLNLSNFDTSKVTNMSDMFNYCGVLDTIDLSNFDTSKVTDMSTMFQNCYKLTTILGIISADNVKNINAMFYNCNRLTNFSGLLNLGQAYDVSKSANYYAYKVDLSKSTKLTEQSLINVLTNLYDIATKGVAQQQCVLGSTNLAKLTSEEGKLALSNAQAKGWSIS